MGHLVSLPPGEPGDADLHLRDSLRRLGGRKSAAYPHTAANDEGTGLGNGVEWWIRFRHSRLAGLHGGPPTLAGENSGRKRGGIRYDLLHRPALVRTHSRLDAHVSDEPIGNSGEGRFRLRFRGAYCGWLPGRMLLPRRERHGVPVDRQHVE